MSVPKLDMGLHSASERPQSKWHIAPGSTGPAAGFLCLIADTWPLFCSLWPPSVMVEAKPCTVCAFLEGGEALSCFSCRHCGFLVAEDYGCRPFRYPDPA